jgi:hypothetical protein
VSALDDLVSLVPPPAAPVDAHGDWAAVEAALGLRLPADFQALIARYGLGSFADVTLLTPFDTHTGGLLDLVRHARDLRDMFEGHRADWPEDFPHPLYPEPGGLLEWAGTGDGDMLCWLTTGAADTWPVVVWNIREGAHRYDVGAVELLHGYLGGRREVELLRQPPAVPWFDPYRERTFVNATLSDSDLPYAERLGILSDLLAPTEDRGSHVDDVLDRRQDHFKAVTRDWLLMYQSFGRHGFQVACPPADKAEARAVLDAVARAMGCRVLDVSP